MRSSLANLFHLRRLGVSHFVCMMAFLGATGIAASPEALTAALNGGTVADDDNDTEDAADPQSVSTARQRAASPKPSRSFAGIPSRSMSFPSERLRPSRAVSSNPFCLGLNPQLRC